MSKDIFRELHNLYHNKHNEILSYLYKEINYEYHSFRIYTQDDKRNDLNIHINFDTTPERNLMNTSGFITNPKDFYIKSNSIDPISMQDIQHIIKKLKEKIPKTENIKKINSLKVFN